MILQRLKTTLRTRREASLGDLSREMEAAPEAVETMLDHWIARGQVEKRAPACSKSGCSCGKKTDGALYVWTGT
ncbi:FeoC-like transcriptional regulator [Pararhodospirillum photometricum]|uniref:Transcriptional regulator HTH-type FeoC domain-containing protein n=1 Tax=Pararhodospirillum photometricum DSM 122 TaxID=1150469 RepID=H6SRC0_PARPM|nr:FeoC-like transcriptional regulator [Pararhodospirillum photometricum]CCG09842.1 Putative uncharacterized protein [Pararhodospirillum photometricum DSM 122]